MRRQRGTSLADDVVLVAHNEQTNNYTVLCWSNKARQNQQIKIKLLKTTTHQNSNNYHNKKISKRHVRAHRADPLNKRKSWMNDNIKTIFRCLDNYTSLFSQIWNNLILQTTLSMSKLKPPEMITV